MPIRDIFKSRRRFAMEQFEAARVALLGHRICVFHGLQPEWSSGLCASCIQDEIERKKNLAKARCRVAAWMLSKDAPFEYAAIKSKLSQEFVQ